MLLVIGHGAAAILCHVFGGRVLFKLRNQCRVKNFNDFFFRLSGFPEHFLNGAGLRNFDVGDWRGSQHFQRGRVPFRVHGLRLRDAPEKCPDPLPAVLFRFLGPRLILHARTVLARVRFLKVLRQLLNLVG